MMPQRSVAVSGRIFKSDVLEALTRTHIAIPLALYWSAGALGLWYSIDKLDIFWGNAVLLFLAGVLVFTLLEYLMHRFLYHLPASTPKRARLRYVLHGVHHEFPRDKRRLAQPPATSIALSALLLLLFTTIMGDLGFAFTAGLLFGYSSYLAIHYATHMFKPPKNILGVLWKNHNLHHYVNDDGAFGVSSPLWDHVFGTMPPDPKRRAAEREHLL
jgi:sterol desaturase/sphingolipid hydroxylase (fatty acid hydroxylase superfamily)